MAEPDVWRCNRCGWEYPNKHPNAKHRRNHKKKCGKLVRPAEAEGAEVAAPAGGSSDDDALSDDEQQQHTVTVSSNGSMEAPHSADTHIEGPETDDTRGSGEESKTEVNGRQADVGVLESEDEGKAGRDQSEAGAEAPDEIQESGPGPASEMHPDTKAVNDESVELVGPKVRESQSVPKMPSTVVTANEEVEQTALPASELPEDKVEAAKEHSVESQEVGKLWEQLLEAEEQGQEQHPKIGHSNTNVAPQSADPSPGGEVKAGGQGQVFVEMDQTTFPSVAADEQSSGLASKQLEDKGNLSLGDPSAKDESSENQGVRELWEQLLEADLKDNKSQSGVLDASLVAPVAAAIEAQQVQPDYVQESVTLVPGVGAASLNGELEAKGTNPFLADGVKQQIEQPQSSQQEPQTWKAFPTDEDDKNGSNAVINPFVGSEGFRASKVDESDIKAHVALQALFETDVKRIEGDDSSLLINTENEARVKSSKDSNSTKKPRSRWSSFICCGAQQ